jgi:CubicO group peptidase (beta-lactamase class C family)
MIAHLLLHTSGIADYAEEDDQVPTHLEDYASLWQERPNYRMLRPLDFLPLFADLPPYRPPGQIWQYCNAGYVLLGNHLGAPDRTDLRRPGPRARFSTGQA